MNRVNEKVAEQEAQAERGQACLASLVYFLRDIKLSHSVFALPFAMVGLIFARVGVPSFAQLVYLLLSMVAARSYAMGMNRYLDRHIDAANPRTAIRMIPQGRLKAKQALFWSLAWGALFVFSAFQLQFLAGLLSVPVLGLLGFYSLMKRLSWLTHWYLGFCLGMAPVAVNIALGVELKLVVVLIGLAVMMWTAGFDILYALQDGAFDRQNQLHSVPVRFGAAGSLSISRLCFGAMIALLATAGYLEDAGILYFIGVLVVAAILVYEQWLVRDAKERGSSKNINAAFFNVNGWVSVVFYILVQADRLW